VKVCTVPAGAAPLGEAPVSEIADGEHGLADAQLGAAADRDRRRQIGGHVDLQHGEIVLGARADEARLEAALIA
jgi:hypothetical protein